MKELQIYIVLGSKKVVMTFSINERCWCNGYHPRFPFSGPGFDSRTAQFFLSFLLYFLIWLIKKALKIVEIFQLSSSFMKVGQTPKNNLERIFSLAFPWASFVYSELFVEQQLFSGPLGKFLMIAKKIWDAAFPQ